MDLDLVEESIRIECSQGHAGRVPERYAGRKIRCRRCGEVLRVPRAGWDDGPDFGAPSASSARSRPSGRRSSSFLQAFADRDKRPLIGAIAAVVLLASTGLTLAVSGWRPWATDPLRYVPNSMDVVAQVDLGRLRTEAPELNDWLQRQEERQPSKAAKELLDPSQIRRVLIASDTDRAGGSGLVMIELAHFDPTLLTRAGDAKQELGVVEETFQGHTYYSCTRLPKKPAVLVISPTLIAFGDSVSIKQAIKLADGEGKSIRDNPSIAPLLDDHGEQVFWLAAVVNGKAREMTKKVAELHSVKLAVDYRRASEMASVTGTAQFGSAKDALKGKKLVADALEQLEPKREAVAAAAPRGMMSKLQGLVASTTLEATGRQLEARVDIDVAKVKQLGKDMEQSFARK